MYLVTTASAEWLRLYRHYTRAILPLAGGIYDQPARYIEAMELIDSNQNAS